MRASPRIAKGQRIYAIGDVHGCLDLLVALFARIRDDADGRPPLRTRILFIGDVVDRGPRSREIVEWLWANVSTHRDLIVLRGNHEQAMVQALSGDEASLDAWLRFGGRETLMSWGLRPEDLARDLAVVMARARAAVPAAILAWLAALPLRFRSEDYLFVHAGIRPGRPAMFQTAEDMLWIREDFLDVETRHRAMIVHGHTVREDGPEMLDHRINLDTGAYRTGRLSAVGFEGDRRWPISVTGAGAGATDAAAAYRA